MATKRRKKTRKTITRTRTKKSDNFYRAFGDGVHEVFAIGLGEDAAIEDGDDARIGLGANQAADALAEFKNGLRKGELAKRIAATSFNSLDARFDQRMIRDSEWQTGDDNIRKGFTGDIHTLPETVSAKENGVHVLLEF